MKTTLTRQHFIKSSVATASALFVPTFLKSQPLQEKPAPLSVELVKEFVGASHGKLDRVRELLASEPQLLHASFDWGGGDFESGIEAAGHVGNKEIAAFLLSAGARYNIYLACMLGHLETVKTTLTLYPTLLNSKGPHGFTLLHHAIKGGESSAPVVDYLKSLGATETRVDFYGKG
jgi:hypothetical protein